jgi:predicted flap endonuclease-1-like 5' DNA nuclease
MTEKSSKTDDPVQMEITAPTPAAPNRQTVEKSFPFKSDLTLMKGIDERRAVKLKELGYSLGELAKVSADDLTKDRGISPKITKKWIPSAKESHK